MSLFVHWQRAQEGQTVTFRPRGSSMKGLVPDNSLVVVKPVDVSTLEVGQVVLVRVKGKIYLHKILGIQGSRFLIGNNRGGTNGWTQGTNVAGRCVSVDGREI